MALDSLTKRITLMKVHELLPRLSGVVTATSAQSIKALNLDLEQDLDGVSEPEAVSIEAWLRASASCTLPTR